MPTLKLTTTALRAEPLPLLLHVYSYSDVKDVLWSWFLHLPNGLGKHMIHVGSVMTCIYEETEIAWRYEYVEINQYYTHSSPLLETNAGTYVS